jgi:hypothetical protein
LFCLDSIGIVVVLLGSTPSSQVFLLLLGMLTLVGIEVIGFGV